MTDRQIGNPFEAKVPLEDRSLREKAAGKGTLAIPRRSAQGAAPLSVAQERLWVLDQLDPGKPFANIPRAFRIRGRLDVEALRCALYAICERHEVLRSVFGLVDGNPVQVAAVSPTTSLPIVDLSALAEEAREAEALRLAEEDAWTPFDLAREPLLRTKLLRLGAEDHVLFLTVHHIVFDAPSTDIFDRELEELYQAYRDKQPPLLRPLPIQYADFAVWQREWLSGRVLEEQLSYWKHQLEGAPAVLELPSSRRHPPESTFRGATETVSIGRELTEAIRLFSQREGATLFMSLLAAFQVLLLRHSGRGDIAVGSPVSGRNRSNLERLIGLFANPLVFRTGLSGDPPFRELLRRVREVAVEAYANEEVPFERLIEELKPERTLSHAPLFQVLLTLQNASAAPLRLADLSVTPLPLRAEIARYDLTLSFTDRKEEMSASLQYNTDLFQAATARRMLAHLKVLLGGIVEDPARRLSHLPLMGAEERHQVLVEWNQTEVEYPKEMTVHRLFEEQAKRTPDAVAVELEGEGLTYEELHRRSNRLARYLQGLGVGPEVLVGLCVERSLNMVVALLGILKAGGAYLPLDPAYPAERLRHMLEDSDAALVMTDRAVASSVSMSSARTVVFDTLWDAIAEQSDESLESVVAPHSLAYVIYTSGSAGRPKGVEIEHRSLANYARYIGELYALRPGDRCLQFASLSFDASAGEIFSTLSSGATLVLRTEEMIATAAAFFAKCREWKLTAVDLPTSYWHELIASASAESLALPESLRLVVFGGEKAFPDRLAQWQERAAEGVRFLNGYGPSEATVAATFWELSVGGLKSGSRTVPIGRPIANARTYVLDETLQPVAAGILGELYIGGVGLARGYRKRPDLTTERFIQDPFRGGGERLYRTGDRVRYRSDGNLEYFGRADEQVKLRGFRVEPGEVETALRAHPAVREAAVVLKGEAAHQRLVAYLVQREGETPLATDLRSFLKRTLPDFMIPAAFVTLAALPLTPNGKVDRKALPELGGARPGLERKYVAPRDLVEIKLARLWQRVLNLDRVGMQDDFFELGGHSLLAVRLLFEVEKSFDRRLPLSVIFDAPTVGQLASLLREEGWSPSWSSLVPIQAGGSRPPLYCVHALGGNVLTYKLLSRHLGPDQPIYALQAQGLDGTQPPHTRVEDMAAHYIKAIGQLQPEGPYPLAGFSFGGVVAFEMARQLRVAGQKVSLVALLDTDNLPAPPPDPESPAQLGYLGFVARRLRIHLGRLRRLRPKEAVSYFRDKAEVAVQWIRGTIRARQEWHSLPEPIRIVNAANTQAARAYVPGSYEGPVTLFRACERRRTNPSDPDLGWAEVCRGGLEIVEIPGGHFSILEEPEVQELARELGARLAALEETDGERVQSWRDTVNSSSAG
jgi:amino acid adenylation domain-containing protein